MKTLPCVQLPCPRCGEPSANVSVQLWTLDDPEGENFHCGECEGTFSRADLERDLRALGALSIGHAERRPR